MVAKPKRAPKRPVYLGKSAKETSPTCVRLAQETKSLHRPLEDPVTSERYYDDEESLYLAECERYREKYRRRFLNACDYLHIVKAMGYSKS